ncbi:ArsR/SmtB family transcription factor [Kitasatospora purpeofusca]|uniref:ArsR/SmtB family transcription factor n=1 Tax=Kitasatospora purpeofusca TaxID=67352 RepID=UPI00225658F7|nr:winged helix-turn-helix domain-containing protein [Kitasatospora purpeofusca]MCX4755846.1 winged helix-turn-helix domain-containing protein [Kitasatospora purpeofusca]WSR36300.1 winged helix-turn-helix domain-containing protein [Kitasatospora purpeofusca]
MLRIELDARALANTRFVVSPLYNVTDSLWLIRSAAGAAGAGGRGAGALIREAVRERRLAVLESFFTGAWTYIPDFLNPQPEQHEESLERELHAVATVAPERLAQEIRTMLAGDEGLGIAGGRAPRALLRALDRGEAEFAELVAAELHQLWQSAVGPRWPMLRARIDADIARRAQLSARQGLASVLAGLHPRVLYDEEGVRLLVDARAELPATGLDLTPTVFSSELHVSVDPLPGARQLRPMILYPAFPAPGAGPDAGPGPEPGPASPAGDLIGATRARLLADLDVPRSTTELAERHWLAASTVSYHLGVLHRAGLLVRTRSGRRALYQQAPRAEALRQEG